MGRPIREIYSGQVYDGCIRTRQGLPFVYTDYMKMLLEGTMARVQRDSKVTLCHYLWMANHLHMILIAKDKKACTQFYGELQRQLTEAVKRLCGFNQLSLWKGNAAYLVPFHDLETACYRIGYIYANPASAHLIDSIGKYEGSSSWEAYSKNKSSLTAEYTKECEWVRARYIKPFADYEKGISREEDSAICAEWKRRANLSKDSSHELVLHPNLWMKQFGIESDKEVKETNEKINEYLVGQEEDARNERKKKKRKPMGSKKLFSQGINMTYLPDERHSRRITVYSLDPELRMHLIEQYKEFCKRCRECYEKWKVGDFTVDWPPGAIPPARPHTQNNFSPHMSNVY